MSAPNPVLLGPMFFYDVVRTTRRGRFLWYRCLYAGVLLVVLFLLYSSSPDLRQGIVHRSELADLAAAFFYAFAGVQFGLMFLLTPAFTGGVIAEEKERKTLEFLLATGLSDREIVLGKTVSRLAQLALIALTGLPVLGFLQFLGGVDPQLVLASFAATAVTMLSLAGVSLRLSLTAAKPADAIFGTYFWAAMYLLASGFCAPLCGWFGGVGGPVEWFCAGNPGVALARLADTRWSTTPLEARVLGVTAGYVLFHAVVAAYYLILAPARLRAWTLHAQDQPRREPAAAPAVPAQTPVLFPTFRRVLDRVYQRPPVGEQPVLWKELYTEPGALRKMWSYPTFRVLILAGITAGVIILFGFTPAVDRLMSDPAAWVRGWGQLTRIGGTGLAALLLLTVALRASGSISSERDRQTWDTLLSTPLSNRDILLGKWLGSLLSIRWLLCGLAAMWTLAAAVGSIPLSAFFMLIPFWVIYVCFCASLGVWLSLHVRSALYSFAIMLGLALFLTRPGLVCCGGLPSEVETGISPLWTLHWLTYYDVNVISPQAWHEAYHSDWWNMSGMAILAIFGYAVLGVVLWRLVQSQFGSATLRMPCPTSLDEIRAYRRWRARHG